VRAVALALVMAAPAPVFADRFEAERWSAAAAIGVEALPDSAGEGLAATVLYGAVGTVRLHRLVCVEARFGAGGGEDGSETTRVEETRLRFDLRAALCPAVNRFLTVVVGLGPAIGTSLYRAQLDDQKKSYSAFDLGLSLDAGALVRLGPGLVRFDLEAGVVRRIALGAFAAFGVAI
jgi:outer membrane protein with beta-barrel domain